jgi:hypothetical protein
MEEMVLFCNDDDRKYFLSGLSARQLGVGTSAIGMAFRKMVSDTGK